MKKRIIFTFMLVATFGLGFAFRSLITNVTYDEPTQKRVTGIGGIFFKCKEPAKQREWYKSNLGFNINDYGAVFEWYQGADSTKKGFTQWSPFKESTSYFSPSTKEFMINYRVGNLERLVADLKLNGVTITDTIETYDYGKFVHIMDPEGNKIELWEPFDAVYEMMGKQMGSTTIK